MLCSYFLLVPGFNDELSSIENGLFEDFKNDLPSKDIVHQAIRPWNGNRSNEKIRSNYVSETMKYARSKNVKNIFSNISTILSTLIAKPVTALHKK